MHDATLKKMLGKFKKQVKLKSAFNYTQLSPSTKADTLNSCEK
jgi:hypothetical protein